METNLTEENSPFTASEDRRARTAPLLNRRLALFMGAMVLAGGLVTWILVTDGVRDVAYALSFTLLQI